MASKNLADNTVDSKIKFELSAPSNIALVKYWGKIKGEQIPINPSISMTLDRCRTFIEGQVSLTQSEGFIDLDFEGDIPQKFSERVLKNLQVWNQSVGMGLHFSVKTYNNFPHSSGIASSASSFAAWSFLFESILALINTREFSIVGASSNARLASGSACRSLAGPWQSWGRSHLSDSNNYAISLEDVDLHLNDSVVIIDEGVKAISSSEGHALMENHVYKDARINQANNNYKNLYSALKDSRWESIFKIVEEEALSLHALMLSSSKQYCLIKPEAWKFLEEFKIFRERKQVKACFTLDAGTNIHLLYPEESKESVLQFLSNYASQYKIIHDQSGLGAQGEFYYKSQKYCYDQDGHQLKRVNN